MILVTGGTGLVGSHLLYELTKKEKPIRAIYRTESSRDKVKEIFSYYSDQPEKHFEQIEWVKADITDIPSMIPVFEGVTEVYHSAALISFDPKDYVEMRKVNIHGTAIVVNLSIDVGVKKLCYVSSIAALGDQPSKGFLDEENEFNTNQPNSGYAITKYGGEMEVWRASQEGVEVIIVNPGVILGPGYWYSGSGSLFSQIAKGFPFYTEGVTGFVSVKDVATAMIRLMSAQVKNERFILVSENVSFQTIFHWIAKALNVKLPRKKVTSLFTNLFWRWEVLKTLFTGKKPRLTKHTARSLHQKTYYKNDKVRQTIGLKFESIETTVEKVANYYSR